MPEKGCKKHQYHFQAHSTAVLLRMICKGHPAIAPTVTDYTKTIMGSSVGFSTKHAACVALTFGGQYGHKMNIPFPVNGDIIYSSPNSTTPVNGGGNWYGLFYPDTTTGNTSHNHPYVAQLSSAGVVGPSNSVPLLVSGNPDCSLIY